MAMKILRHFARSARLMSLLPIACVLLGFGATLANAADAGASLEQRVAKLEAASQSATPAINTGDNAWLLASCALVLMMTAPGLILFYGGLVRSKNVLSTMMHSLILMALVSTLWMVFGYSMAFAPGNAFCRQSAAPILCCKGVGGAPNADYAATVPQQTFMLFQMMFAIITPALISGAVAERIKFKAYVAVHACSGSRWFIFRCATWSGARAAFSTGRSAEKFRCWISPAARSSTSVPACRRWCCALMLGKRDGYPQEPMMPHNVVLSLIGTGLLWVGWFGFNAGSALSAGALATSAFAATHFSAAAAALSWAAMEWLHKGKPSVLGAASGMVAGLATITPASGFVIDSGGVLHRAGRGRGLLFGRHENESACLATTIRWTCLAFTASAA